MAKIQDIRRLAEQEAKEVSGSPRDWMGYLDTASRLYRYPFSDTLLIHAQRPQATACAPLELWNRKMFRWVNRGAKGIALLDDTGPRLFVRYVFDIAGTHLVRDGRTPYLWQVQDHQQEMLRDHLIDGYGLDGDATPNLQAAIRAYQQLSNHLEKQIGMENTEHPEHPPSHMSLISCRNGLDELEDMDSASLSRKWINQEAQAAHRVAQEYLDNCDTAIAYRMGDVYFMIQTVPEGYDYTFYRVDFSEIDGGVYDDPDIGIGEARDEIVRDFAGSAAHPPLSVIDYDEFMDLVSDSERPEEALNGKSRTDY